MLVPGLPRGASAALATGVESEHHLCSTRRQTLGALAKEGR
jgi:hypothetical protein